MLPIIDPARELPADLRFLSQRYPRESWAEHANLGTLARFWLQRHAMFRELAPLLDGGVARLREGQIEPAAFRDWFAPRVRFLLQQLEAHHQIEDLRYFPIFRRAEPRLGKGFDLLEGDHLALDGMIAELARTGSLLLASLAGVPETRLQAAHRHAEASAPFLRALGRHLDDEEDLIVPLILERSEGGLGVA